MAVIGLCQSAGSLCGAGAPRVLFVTCWKTAVPNVESASIPVIQLTGIKLEGGGAWAAPTVNTVRGP